MENTFLHAIKCACQRRPQQKGGSGINGKAQSGHRAFLRAFLSEPDVVGAVTPSSTRLACTLLQPFANRTEPARLLEVGAGTGAITRCIPRFMNDDDHVTICEMVPTLADHLREHVLTRPDYSPHVQANRVKLMVCPVQDISGEDKFDYIVCGLPFTAFSPELIREVLVCFRRLLRPGGVFSYFEYVILRRLRTVCSVGRTRERMREVSAILNSNIRASQFERRTVFANLPPAHARYCRFESNGS